ncbi:hypothetical protein [Nocardia sp. CS682]|uniref:hypothetical protein n=1 Tax=Nocardia sp. CS682 TaxID=1047172 RepID=UPI0010753D7D|nr:hypothetical protein [Nocardia sp. CS682]QBS42350.1 hypothetical protein DMB37_21695 [Nocardia sp. CS682]
MTYASERPAAPSGAVATTAVVLALCAGLLNLWGAGTVLSALRGESHIDQSMAVFSILGALLAAITLGYGAVLLLRRDETGRYLLILTSGLLTAIALVALACSLTDYQPEYGIDWLPTESHSLEAVNALFNGLVGSVTALLHREWLASLTAAVLPLAVFLAASSGYTTRWIAYTPPRFRAESSYSEVPLEQAGI